MKPRDFALADFVTPSQGQGQWNWYETVEVNRAYKYGKYEKFWSKNLSVMSNIKVLLARPLAGQTKLWYGQWIWTKKSNI